MLELKGVFKKYRSLAGDVLALKGIGLKIAAGEFLIVMGKSGAGKTTLVNLLAALDNLSAGEYWAGTTPVHRLNSEQAAHWRGRTVGVVFQSFELLPGLNLVQNITLPMAFAGLIPLWERQKRALSLLDQMEIAEHAWKRPAAISGGQQQRVAIARALANDPPIIMADEPTGSLDSVTAQAVMKVFQGVAAQGKTVVLVTHDPDIAQWGSRVIHLVDGEIQHD